MVRLALLLLSPLALAGCLGGGSDLTDIEITQAMLAAMVLPKEELGDAYADFELADESGVTDNDDVVEGDLNEEDEREDIERFGRVTGYSLQYASPTALFRGSGAFLVSTDVSLYEDADGASGDLEDQLQDIQAQVGQTQDGATLEAVEELEDVPQIADGTWGMTVDVTGEGEVRRIRAHAIAFQRGRLIGVATIGQLDDEDVTVELTELARKLDERIVAVLEGEIDPADVPTPASEDDAGEPTRPGTAGSPTSQLDTFRFSSEITVATDDGEFAIAADGAFRAPDRMSCTVSGTIGGITFEEAMVVIGDQAWFDDGSGFAERPRSDGDVQSNLAICPGAPEFWTDWDFIEDAEALPGEPEARNGVATTRIPLGEVAAAAAGLGFLPPELEGVTVDAFDVWIAEEGGWTVALDIRMTVDPAVADEFFGGAPFAMDGPASLTMRVDITDANDAAILVEPPGTTEVPADDIYVP